MLPSIGRHVPEGDDINKIDVARVQDRFEEWVNKLKTEVPILDGVLLEDLDLTTTAADFTHRLDRKWRGYIVTRQDAAQIVFAARVSTAADTNFIRLDADGAVNVDVWVF